jgi:small conductance mechanosensitive channel
VTYLIAFGVFFVVRIGSKWIIAKIKFHIQQNALQTELYNQKIANLAGRILWIISIIFNILIMCEILGLHTTLLMGGISLSLGFAMENTIENMIAGLMLITGKKIQIGEYIEFLGTLNIRGTVQEITIRHTTIKCFDKRRIVIPNSIISKTPIRKMKSEELIRGEITIEVPRETDIDSIKTVLREHINTHP